MNGLKMSTIFASKYISLSIKFTTVLVRPLFLKENEVSETFGES